MTTVPKVFYIDYNDASTFHISLQHIYPSLSIVFCTDLYCTVLHRLHYFAFCIVLCILVLVWYTCTALIHIYYNNDLAGWQYILLYSVFANLVI